MVKNLFSSKRKFTASVIVATSTALALTFSSLPTVFAASFSDVGADEIYQSGIEFLKSEGIVNGYGDGTFKPAQTLNRAEMMKIIAEGAKTYFNWPENVFSGYESKSCFTDVTANQWYTKYVCYGKEKGWVVGYDGGKKFNPTQEVTFVEGLKISYKGFGLEYSETGTPWYKDVVEFAGEKNYIPFDIRAFAGPLQRNQMADLVTRILKSEAGAAELDSYLGARKDLVVTYETISAGLNLTEMDVVELP